MCFPARSRRWPLDYLSLIREIQPVGPYNLLGWSFGGLVAHAIATQLQSDGQEVALLALLDSYPIATVSNQLRDPARNVKRSFYLLEWPTTRCRKCWNTASRGTHPFGLEEHDHEAITDAYKNNTRIMRAFLPQRFRGDILLFVATEDETKPPIESWTPYVDGKSRSTGSTAPTTP